jgi:acyl dehydratase
MIEYEKLKNWKFPEVTHTYTRRETAHYALGCGLGIDFVDEEQLTFVQGDNLRALPTMAVILGFPGSWLQNPDTGVDYTMVVHGEEAIRLHAPIPAEGTVTSRHRVTHVVDKGKGKGALVTYDKEVFGADGTRLATVTHTTFCRADGGFGEGDAPAPAPERVPDGAPDIVCDLPTSTQQALIYRLVADMNPLHSDVGVARKAGFPAPILHGLSTYGVAGHAILKTCCEYDPAKLLALRTRFSSPVYPGDTIRFEIYRRGNKASFRARVRNRNVTVLDFGHAELAS